MNKKKRILIIVHGAKPLDCKTGLFCRAYKKTMSFLTSPGGMLFSDYRKFKKYMKPHYDKVILFKWSGGILRFHDLESSSERLKKLLERKRNCEVDVAAFSLGSFVSERALEKLKDFQVHKLMLIGAVHEPFFRFEMPEIIYNVYSEVDKLALLANELYSFTKRKSFRIKHKKVKNFSFKKLNHDDLSKNVFVSELGKNLYELYKELLVE